MRHSKGGKKLGRTYTHRKAMFRNMARSLLTYGQIKTTETKAMELRKVADKLVTLGLRNDLHSRRLAYKVLENHQLVQKLFDEIAPRFGGSERRFHPSLQAWPSPRRRLRSHGRHRAYSPRGCCRSRS